MDVLSSRILLRPADLGRSRHFYRDVLGLAVYREFGSPANPSMVFFLGPGLLEISGNATSPPDQSVMIWLQVRDVHAEHERLAAAGALILRGPEVEPWGLTEMWIEDPDGLRIVLVEIPPITRCAEIRDLRPHQRDTTRGMTGCCRMPSDARMVLRADSASWRHAC